MHSRAFAAVLLCCSCAAQSLVLQHVTIVGVRPLKNVSVAIDGARIQAIKKRIRPRRGTRVIDAKGKFLIPGLWDMHIHLGPPETFFPLLLASGITGVREMYTGIPMSTIRAWRALPGAPRIVAPGFIDGPLMLTAGPPPPGAFAVATPDQARFAVHALAQSGVDFLKVYNSIPREAYFALAQEARAIGMPFAGHVPEAVSPAEASDAGQRSQEHLINVLLACSTNEEELRAGRIATMTSPAISGEERMRLLGFPKPEGLFDTYSEEKAATLFQTFVRNGTWHTPTLALLDGFVRAPDRKLFFLKDLSPAEFDALIARIQALLARYEKLVGDMHRAGVEFLAGTDANGSNPVQPGAGLHRELELLVESGLTPLEALQCATLNPARYFGRLNEMGTVEAGKAADLVLLNADPAVDIRNTQKIEAVIQRGRYYPAR